MTASKKTKTPKQPVLQIFRRADADWGVRLRGKNGRKMFSLEGFRRKPSAARAANRMKTIDWSKVEIVEV